MEKLLNELLKAKNIENTFKFLTWIAFCALFLVAIVNNFSAGGWPGIIVGLLLIPILFLNIAQAFVFGISQLAVPICQARFPNANILQADRQMTEKGSGFRVRMIKTQLKMPIGRSLLAACIAIFLVFFAAFQVLVLAAIPNA